MLLFLAAVKPCGGIELGFAVKHYLVHLLDGCWKLVAYEEAKLDLGNNSKPWYTFEVFIKRKYCVNTIVFAG